VALAFRESQQSLAADAPAAKVGCGQNDSAEKEQPAGARIRDDADLEDGAVSECAVGGGEGTPLR